MNQIFSYGIALSKKRMLADYLILLLVLLLGIWQLFLGVSVMKWDTIDIYLPWKNFVGEAITNANLPLWNPFLNSGFPQMGDPNTWYPVSWIIALLKRYDIYAVQIEYLFHLYIAGIGMYKVTRHYTMSRPSGIILASSYMLCGFFISNAQHIGWIISAAWFPFIYFYFVQLKSKPGWLVSIKLGFCFFMMLSGGYPGIFISSFYLFLVFSIYFFIQFLSRKDFITLKQWLIFLTVSAFVFLLLSAVVIVSSLDLTAHISRGKGLPFDNSHWGILTGSLTPKALITFVFPYPASINNQGFWGSDFSIINCYMGIIPLLLMIFVSFQKSTAFKVRVFVIIGVLFLLTAFAEIIPFRKWLYMFLPFMDLFRFSALFRLFAIFFFLLAAGLGLDSLLKNEDARKKFFRYLIVALIAFGGLQLFLYFRIEKWQFKQLFLGGITSFDKIAGIKEKMFFQGLIQSGIIAILIILFKYHPKNYVRYIVCIGCIDMVLVTQMNIYGTVVYNIPAENVNHSFSKFPDEYPIPSLSVPMTQTNNEILKVTIPFLGANPAIYLKIPSCDGNSPYGLNTMSEGMRNGNYQAILNNPLLFLASFRNSSSLVDTNSIDKKSCEQIIISEFNPNLLKAKIKTDKAEMLVFLQNYYPYWKATVNGKEQEIIKTNDSFMAVQMEQGSNDVILAFKPVKVRYAFYVSLSSFILFIIIILTPFFRNKIKQKKYFSVALTGILTFLVAIMVTSNLYGRHSSKEIYRRLNKLVTKQIHEKGTAYIYNVDDTSSIINTNEFKTIKIYSKRDIGKLITLLESSKESSLYYAQANRINYPEIKAIITDFYPNVSSEEDWGSSFFISTTKKAKGKNPYFLVSFNDFESDCAGWTVKKVELDSTGVYSGKKCLKLDSINNFSTVFSRKFSDITTSKRCIIRISLYAKFYQVAEPMIVFSTRSGDKNIIWQGENMNNDCHTPQQWTKAYLVKEIDSDIKPNDIVEIYVWNNSKQTVKIDDFKIEVRDR